MAIIIADDEAVSEWRRLQANIFSSLHRSHTRQRLPIGSTVKWASAPGGWTNAAACETLGWMSAEEPIRHAEELEREVAPCSGGWTGR